MVQFLILCFAAIVHVLDGDLTCFSFGGIGLTELTSIHRVIATDSTASDDVVLRPA